jgi:hypothetical protein
VPRIPKGETRRAIREVLRRGEAGMDAIVDGVSRRVPGVPRHSVRSGLNQLHAAGEVERTGHGRYRLR